jgi:hypothetical protein
MIQLQKNTLNTFYLTLVEKMQTASNSVLIQLESQATKKTVEFLPRSRSHDARKDSLTVREGSVNNPVVGDILLNTPQFPEGWYSYTVWEQTSGTNLDPTDASVIGVIEVGLAYVRDSSVAFGESTYESYNNTDTGYTFYE